jgi:site-specific recombinase XerD
MLDLSGFEAYLRDKELSNNTISCYIRDSKVFIDWYSSRTDARLGKLIQLDAIEYKKYLYSTNKSVVTANRKVASINALCKWLYESGSTPDEINIKAVKSRDARQYKGLDERDLRKLRAEIHRNRNPLHICIIELLLGTGLRVSELCNLKLLSAIYRERHLGRSRLTVSYSVSIRRYPVGHYPAYRRCVNRPAYTQFFK